MSVNYDGTTKVPNCFHSYNLIKGAPMNLLAKYLANGNKYKTSPSLFLRALKKHHLLFTFIFLCFGCSQGPSEEGGPDMKDDLLDMMPDMVKQDMFVKKDIAFDASQDLNEMNEPDLLTPGRPCEMDSQCIRGSVCDRDKCSVIVGCAEFFDDPPPTLIGKGCLVTGFSKSQTVTFECDLDSECDEGKPCVMNACQDGRRCSEDSECLMKVCYAEVCVEPRD